MGTQKIWAVHGYAHAPFSSKFNGLLFRWTLEMYQPNLQSAAYPFPYSDWSFGWGLRTQILGWRRPYRGRNMEPFERALVSSYRPSRLHSIFCSIFMRLRDCRFCAPARTHFPTSPLVSPKISPCSPGNSLGV